VAQRADRVWRQRPQAHLAQLLRPQRAEQQRQALPRPGASAQPPLEPARFVWRSTVSKVPPRARARCLSKADNDGLCQALCSRRAAAAGAGLRARPEAAVQCGRGRRAGARLVLAVDHAAAADLLEQRVRGAAAHRLGHRSLLAPLRATPRLGRARLALRTAGAAQRMQAASCLPHLLAAINGPCKTKNEEHR